MCVVFFFCWNGQACFQKLLFIQIFNKSIASSDLCALNTHSGINFDRFVFLCLLSYRNRLFEINYPNYDFSTKAPKSDEYRYLCLLSALLCFAPIFWMVCRVEFFFLLLHYSFFSLSLLLLLYIFIHYRLLFIDVD